MNISGVILIVIALITAANIGISIWVYKDAKSRGIEAVKWTVIVVLIPHFIGLLLYLFIGRREARRTCPSCGKQLNSRSKYCSYCDIIIVQEQDTSTHLRQSKIPLIIAIVGIISNFVLVIVIVFYTLNGVYIEPIDYEDSTLSIGQVETYFFEKWRLSFIYFNGEKTRQILVNTNNPNELTIEADIEGGVLELGITSDEREKRRILLNDISSPLTLDLNELTESGVVTLSLYGDGARGYVNMEW